jgi:hypothetical protein
VILAGSLEHVKRDHSVVVQKNSLVGNNESHAAHISSEIVHMLATFGHFQAVVQESQINFVELVAELIGLHELVIFPVRTHNIASLYNIPCGIVKNGWINDKTTSLTSAMSCLAMWEPINPAPPPTQTFNLPFTSSSGWSFKNCCTTLLTDEVILGSQRDVELCLIFNEPQL